eukprot:TRINITY_DN19153_c0_g1_i1.p1 TRINITY_DN19153_c0_g1~~TRINITY_DN19153_c0_g1_i1.p1  ORF type:complete len:708 (+),score=184.60 TRINITY_DN19153_c0_g1_i1:118-2124(+)
MQAPAREESPRARAFRAAALRVATLRAALAIAERDLAASAAEAGVSTADLQRLEGAVGQTPSGSSTPAGAISSVLFPNARQGAAPGRSAGGSPVTATTPVSSATGPSPPQQQSNPQAGQSLPAIADKHRRVQELVAKARTKPLPYVFPPEERDLILEGLKVSPYAHLVVTQTSRVEVQPCEDAGGAPPLVVETVNEVGRSRSTRIRASKLFMDHTAEDTRLQAVAAVVRDSAEWTQRPRTCPVTAEMAARALVERFGHDQLLSRRRPGAEPVGRRVPRDFILPGPLEFLRQLLAYAQRPMVGGGVEPGLLNSAPLSARSTPASVCGDAPTSPGMEPFALPAATATQPPLGPAQGLSSASSVDWQQQQPQQQQPQRWSPWVQPSSSGAMHPPSPMLGYGTSPRESPNSTPQMGAQSRTPQGQPLPQAHRVPSDSDQARIELEVDEAELSQKLQANATMLATCVSRSRLCDKVSAVRLQAADVRTVLHRAQPQQLGDGRYVYAYGNTRIVVRRQQSMPVAAVPSPAAAPEEVRAHPSPLTDVRQAPQIDSEDDHDSLPPLEVESEGGTQPDSPGAAAATDPLVATPRALVSRFCDVLLTVSRFNSPGGEPCSAEELAAMDIRFCVPRPEGGVRDLIPNGRQIPVTLDRLQEFVRLAKQHVPHPPHGAPLA